MITDPFLVEHLKMWKDSGIPGPVNELQSIAAWLRMSGTCTLKELQDTMRKRMILLMDASHDLYDEGRAAEDIAGIYDNRPDLKPKDDE
jgi:hypothetical protein